MELLRNFWYLQSSCFSSLQSPPAANLSPRLDRHVRVCDKKLVCAGVANVLQDVIEKVVKQKMSVLIIGPERCGKPLAFELSVYSEKATWL